MKALRITHVFPRAMAPLRHTGKWLAIAWIVGFANSLAVAGEPASPSAADATRPWLDAPFAPDESTLLLSHFDGTIHADHSAGLGLAEGGGNLLPDGRFGGAISIGDYQTLSFEGRQQFPAPEGTIEFWLRPQWNGNDGRVHSVFNAAGAGQNQLSINKLANGRFGAGMFGTPAGSDQFVYARADADISDWRAGQWHHVAVCWGGGALSLWLDGRKAASRSGALPPQVPHAQIRLLGSDCALDEFCISRIVRYSGEGRASGKPVLPRVRLSYAWKFQEPASAYRCTPPQHATAETGLIVLPKNWVDDTDPGNLPSPGPARLELTASPGEQEPATFLIVAEQPLRNVTLQVTELRSERGSLPAEKIAMRRVVRSPMRRMYTAKPSDTEIVSRFLPRWQNLDIPAGEFREAWLQFDLPDDLPSGVYLGSAAVSHDHGRTILPIRLEVLPIHLRNHPGKALASYYSMSRKLPDQARVLRELRDLRAHGVRHLVTAVGIRYEDHGGKICARFEEIQDALGLLRQAGFAGGTMVFETGFPTLARMLGHEDMGKNGNGASLTGDPVFQQAAAEAMQQWVALQQQTPDFRLCLSHLDEVFASRSLLDQYLRLSQAARQVPEARLYITFHTRSDADDGLRRELDPFMDLRCHHGYTFEHWLARGHTMDEYAAELRASGDESWFYHNARGTYWTAEWSRIINGIYLWASPFAAHCPWTYQDYFDNPFDDTDGPESKGHDWGLSFPGPIDPADLVPTRCYEAMREGGDDLRYLATLEHWIAHARGGQSSAAQGARQYLDQWRSLIRNARPLAPSASAGTTNVPVASPAAIDIDTGLVMGQGGIGTAGEAPLIQALASRGNGEQWQQMRRELARWIIQLQEPTAH